MITGCAAWQKQRAAVYGYVAVQVRHVSSDPNVSRWRIGSLQVQGVSETHTRTYQACYLCILRLRLLTVL